MTEQAKKIKVPEGMLEAADKAWKASIEVYPITSALEAALLWQRQNAPVPIDDQLADISWPHKTGKSFYDVQREVIGLWIRRMYDASEPEWAQTCALTEESMRGSLLESGVNTVVVDKVIARFFPK